MLRTEYKKNKFYCDEFGLVVSLYNCSSMPSLYVCTPIQEPVSVELGSTYSYKTSGRKRYLSEKSETFQYVPLIKNLQWVLQNKEVYEEVCSMRYCTAC